jgi:DNA-binding transcriptional ArsR family regulator
MVFVDEAAESVAAFDLAGGRRTGSRGAKKSVRPGNQQFRAPGFNLRTPQASKLWFRLEDEPFLKVNRDFETPHGEPMRIRLLDRLRDGEATVGELSEALSASQQNISKHLAVLADVGILGRRKEGNHVYYRVVDEGVFALCEAVCGSVQEQLRSLHELVSGVSP